MTLNKDDYLWEFNIYEASQTKSIFKYNILDNISLGLQGSQVLTNLTTFVLTYMCGENKVKNFNRQLYLSWSWYHLNILWFVHKNLISFTFNTLKVISLNSCLAICCCSKLNIFVDKPIYWYLAYLQFVIRIQEVNLSHPEL